MLMSAMMVILYVVSYDLRSIVTLTDKFIPDPDSISHIFISEDDSVHEWHVVMVVLCGNFGLVLYFYTYR